MNPIRKSVLLFVAGWLAAASSAFAGDLPLPTKAPLLAPTYDWSGFYLGGHVGGAFESTTFQDPSLAGALICCVLIGTEAPNAAVPNGSAGSFLGGAQAGWNYQIGRFVFGSEVDVSRTNLNSTRTGTAPGVVPAFPVGGFPATESFAIHTDWTATATLNAGIAMDRWLWYGKAGASLAHDTYGLGVSSTFNCFFCGAGPLTFAGSGGEVRPGWTVGAGLAWAFAGSWVATIEYDYLYFAAKPVDFTGTIFSGAGPYVGATFGTNTSQQISEVKLGLDYKFGATGGAAPGSIFAAATPRLFDSASARPNGYDWSGFYVGGHLGAGWQRTDFQDPSATGVLNCCVVIGSMAPGSSAPSALGDAFLGGVQAGWNYQVGRLIVGVSGDFTGSSANTNNVGVTPGATPGSPTAATENFGIRTDWTASATALFGVTNNRWLFYNKLGAAWAHDNYSLGVSGPNTQPPFIGAVGSFSFAQSTSEIRTGLTFGTGLSWALTSNWVASIEYDFLYFPNKAVDFTGPVTNAANGAGAFTSPATFSTNNSQQISQVKLALDYKFTPGGGTAENGPFFASVQPVFASAQPVTLGHDWSGVYVGGHFGGGFTNAAMQDPSLAALLANCCYFIFGQFISNAAIPNASGGALLGGGQAGWNYQVGRFVVGGDFDLSGTNLKASATGASQATAGLSATETLSVRTDWTATATATFGFAALDRLLWYNKFGIAWAHNSYGYNLSGVGNIPFAMQAGSSAIVTGWTIGTGLAWALTDQWSARLEYDYMNFGGKAVDFSGVIPGNLAGVTNPFTSNTMFSQQISEIKLGVNYKFASSLLFW